MAPLAQDTVQWERSVGGVLQRGSAHLRRNATFTANLANGNYVGVINSLANLSTVNAVGTVGALQSQPSGVSGISARILRNGCDRLANNLTNIATRCFPEDYFFANPQLGADAAVGGLSSQHQP